MKTHQDSFSEFEKSKHDEKNTSNDDETTSNKAEAAEVFDSDINSEDIFEETSEFEYKNRYHIREEEDYDDYEHRDTMRRIFTFRMCGMPLMLTPTNLEEMKMHYLSILDIKIKK